MTTKDVDLAVQNLVGLGDEDPEMSHEMQDDLFVRVLKETASGNPQAKEMAQIALKAIDIDFPRWYA